MLYNRFSRDSQPFMMAFGGLLAMVSRIYALNMAQEMTAPARHLCSKLFSLVVIIFTIQALDGVSYLSNKVYLALEAVHSPKI